MEVVRSIDESVWTIHEVVCSMIVSSTVSKPGGDSVLLCEDETVLFALDVANTNTWRQVIWVDGASSVLGLAPTCSLVSVSGVLWSHCWSSSSESVQEGLDHLL